MQRILRVDVCDYENNILCNLYDNKHMVSGSAVDVHITTERNGWKELTFTIPTYCVTDNGEEENFRLEFLKAEYQLRTIDENEEDYFLISEPKIVHDKYSHNVDVRAPHISQLLKNRNLELEFSDEEGNNVGTAKNFLAEILKGTEWSVGEVFKFKERNGNEKVRTLTASNKTGALSLIASLCELFDAVPIYHGGTKKVDLLPINPFGVVIGGEIPQYVLDNDREVLELHYGHSIKTLDKTVNTENLITRLYAYGSSGETYGIDIKGCFHNEYTFTIDEIKPEYHFQDSEGVSYYFSSTDIQVGDTLTWSMLDLTSRTYIRNNRTGNVYRVRKKANGEYETLTASPESKQNWFPYITCFNYFDEIGLISDEILKEIADFQRDMPLLYQASYNASMSLAEIQTELSETANPGDGFARMDVAEVIEINGYSKILLNNTQEHPDAILWRSDYDVKEEKYFQWHVAQKLKENGDPTSGIGSLVFVVRADGTWDSAYLKYIFDSRDEIYRKSNGDPKDYDYRAESDYPTAVALHASGFNIGENDHVYLFCTKSMTGSLGIAQVQDEAVIQNIQDKTTVVTVKHPVIFEEASTVFVPSAPESVTNGYGWLYRYTRNLTAGTLYFCWGERGETIWHRVYYGETEPTVEAGAYFFNTKKKTLHKGADGIWAKYESYDEQQLASTFSTVIYNCRKRDRIYKGVCENYIYNADDLEPGNYAFKSEYEFYWLFTTDQTVNGNLRLDTTNDHIYQDDDVNHIVSASVYPFETIAYPVENELISLVFNPGSIDPSTGLEIESESYYRSSLITLFEGERYEYTLPSNCLIAYYDNKYDFLRADPISGHGTFNPPDVASPLDASIMKHSYYARIVVPSTGGDSDASEEVRHQYQVKVAELNAKLAEFEPIKDEEGTAEWTEIHSQIITLQAQVDELMNTIRNATWVLFDNYYIQVENYANKLYANNKMYIVLSPTEGTGDRKGINQLTVKFDELAIETYEVQLAALNAAQDAITNRDTELKNILGNMLREGWYQDNNYAEGDEYRLYNDSMDNLYEISKPEITYSFTYIDLFESEPVLEDLEDVDWPDPQITDVAHLTDPDITVDVWGYIDKIDKCYDKPWETKLEINTKLSAIGQHDFTDVMSRIASVAKQMKANQPIYDRSKALNSNGTLSSTNLEGAIELHRTALLASGSNWYTDDNNNMIFESADGQTAMLLGGRGFGLARSKNKDGDWEWRQFGDGNGMVADEITAGTISADRIGAQSITVDKIASSVGHDLDISTNRTLSLYATVDGQKPAGALKTTDSIIQIKAGTQNTKAMINVMTGGELNLTGGNVNIESGGKLSIASSGHFYLRAKNADSIDSTAQGIYMSSEDGINIGGGKLLFRMSGNSSSLDVKAQTVTVGMPKQDDANYALVKLDAINGNIDILSSTNLNVSSGKNLTLTSGGIVKIGSGSKPFTVGSDSNGNRAYIYCGPSSIGNATNGAYYGTDGMYIRGTSNNVVHYVKATADGDVDISGTIHTAYGDIGGWTINATSLTGNKTGLAKTTNDSDIAIWAGHTTASSANFYVRQDGYVKATDLHITGSASTINLNDNFIVTGAGAVTIKSGSINIASKFIVDASGNVTATNIDAQGGKIGNWSIDGYNLYTSSGSTRVQLDGSTTLYPLSGLSSPSDHMYAMWAGSASPNTAPFSVTKDGIVTIQKLRIKDGTNSYRTVDFNNFIYPDSEGEDWTNMFGKLHFQTVKGVSQNASTGTVTIKVTNNSGGTGSYTFNTATSVKLGDGTWSSSTREYSAYCGYKYGGNDVKVESKVTTSLTYDWDSGKLFIYGRYASHPDTGRVTLYKFELTSNNPSWGTDHKKTYTISYKIDDYAAVSTGHTILADATNVYNDGWNKGSLAVTLAGSTAASGDTVNKSLDYDEKWIIRGKYYPAGTSTESNTGKTYVVKAPSDRYNTGARAVSLVGMSNGKSGVDKTLSFEETWHIKGQFTPAGSTGTENVGDYCVKAPKSNGGISSVGAPKGSNAQFTVTATANNSTQKTKTYYLTKSGNKVSVHEGSQTGDVVAEYSWT